MISCFLLQELGALKKLQKESLEAIRLEKHENVAVVITSTDLGTQADESQLVEALEAKYDALKDKLLADALMKQVCITHMTLIIGGVMKSPYSISGFSRNDFVALSLFDVLINNNIIVNILQKCQMYKEGFQT